MKLLIVKYHVSTIIHNIRMKQLIMKLSRIETHQHSLMKQLIIKLSRVEGHPQTYNETTHHENVTYRKSSTKFE